MKTSTARSADKPNPNAEMNFLDHLEEFRWVLVKSVIALVLGVILVGTFLTSVTDALAWPLKEASRRLGEPVGTLITNSPLGVFSVFLQVCFFGGFGVALPFILYFVASFVSPGLTPREKRMLVPGCLASLALFLVGCSFSYFFILPLSLLVSMKFNMMFGYEILWTANEYNGLVVWMTLLIGGCFQFPLVLMMMVYANIVTIPQLKAARQIVVVIILVASAIITPSDPISMLVLAVPLYGLYELALIAGRIVRTRKELRAASEKREGDADPDNES